MPGWTWATGEEAPPGVPWRKLLESFAWWTCALALQLELARLSRGSWWVPDFAILAVLGWHWLWGLKGALAAAMSLGLLCDGLGGLPVGLNVSGLIVGGFVVQWMRAGGIGGLGGVWLGPALGASLGAALWRGMIWGWTQGQWPEPLDLVMGSLFTMGAAVAVAMLRKRLLRSHYRRLRILERSRLS